MELVILKKKPHPQKLTFFFVINKLLINLIFVYYNFVKIFIIRYNYFFSNIFFIKFLARCLIFKDYFVLFL